LELVTFATEEYPDITHIFEMLLTIAFGVPV
jgi:hypothetical protein